MRLPANALTFGAILFGLIMALGATPVSPASAQHKSRDEWTQKDADSSHSRHLASTIRPPLHEIWRIHLTVDTWPRDIIAAGGSLYFLGPNDIFEIDAEDGALLATAGFGSNGSSAVATDDGVIFLKAGLRGLRHGGLKEWFTYSAPLAPPLLQRIDGQLISLLNNPSSEDSIQIATLSTPDILASSLTWSLTSHPIRPDHWQRVSEPPFIGEFSGPEHWLYFLELRTLWTWEGGQAPRIHGLEDIDLNNNPAAASADRVFCLDASRSKMRAFDIHANLLWETKIPAQQEGTRRDPHDDISLVVADSRLVAMDLRMVYGIDQKTGKIVWRFDRKTVDGSQRTLPVGTGHVVYLSSASKRGGDADRLTALSISTGKPLWTTRFAGGRLGPMIAHRGAIYALVYPGENVQNTETLLVKLAP